ncbi:hypothetical protein F511_26449 [Dorcoceras hygrometricum]|uniref:Uncharacterized protein n=1 Tax=Dorcoceras hygrometricum TaxID=472368 RepID=A0A2Z7CMJ4_9LAMI|nr:hypothetical protein F511_26449 [Dorcoceras hygrometricum]
MRSVVASHGPGSNPRGPNQTLEEIRPAVTTSPETRRSGGRPAAATSNYSRAARAHAAETSARPALASSRNERATGVDQAAPSIANVAQPVAQPASPIVDQQPSTLRHSCGQRTAAARPARIARARKGGNSRPPHAQRLRVVQRHFQPPCAASAHGCRARMCARREGKGTAAYGGGVAGNSRNFDDPI